jgi:hypothetical protein
LTDEWFDKAYNPSQPRDSHGRWTSSGGGTSGGAGGAGGTPRRVRPTKPLKVIGHSLRQFGETTHDIATFTQFAAGKPHTAGVFRKIGHAAVEMAAAAHELSRLSRNLQRRDYPAAFHNVRVISRSAATIHEHLSSLPGDVDAVNKELEPIRQKVRSALSQLKAALRRQRAVEHAAA